MVRSGRPRVTSRCRTGAVSWLRPGAERATRVLPDRAERDRRCVEKRHRRRHRAPGNLRWSIVHASMVTRRHDDRRFSSPNDRLPPNMFTKRLSDASPASRVSRSTTPDFPSSWSRDGRSIVSVRIDSTSGNDLWVHRLQNPGGERLWFNTRFNESQGNVSPDAGGLPTSPTNPGKTRCGSPASPRATSGDRSRRAGACHRGGARVAARSSTSAAAGNSWRVLLVRGRTGIESRSSARSVQG